MILFDSDRADFGGHDRLAPAKNQRFVRHNEPCNNRRFHLKLYIPNRTAIVLIAEQNFEKNTGSENLFSEESKQMHQLESDLENVSLEDESLKKESETTEKTDKI